MDGLTPVTMEVVPEKPAPLKRGLRDDNLFGGVQSLGPNHGGTINQALPEALFGDNDPQRLKGREQAWERQAQALSLKGWTNVQIAEFLDLNVTTVSNALRQPYARRNMINEAKRTVRDEINEFLESRIMPNLKVLADIADDESARKSDRIAAINSLNDRFLGKPNQPMTIDDGKSPDQLTDEQLEQRVSKLVAGVSATEADSAKPA